MNTAEKLDYRENMYSKEEFDSVLKQLTEAINFEFFNANVNQYLTAYLHESVDYKLLGYDTFNKLKSSAENFLSVFYKIYQIRKFQK